MRDAFPACIEVLITQFARLPGIGRKSAVRMAFYVLERSEQEVSDFAQAMTNAKELIHLCPVCQNLTDEELCSICAHPGRDSSIVCVVSEPRDVVAVEGAREYEGLYHILHGVINASANVGPEDIKIQELIDRVRTQKIQEVILATNPDTEGDTTALYIARLLQPYPVKVTRLAYGIPMGSHVEYTDGATLLRSLEGRREMI
jgi:recombination protein RecR